MRYNVLTMEGKGSHTRLASESNQSLNNLGWSLLDPLSPPRKKWVNKSGFCFVAEKR